MGTDYVAAQIARSDDALERCLCLASEVTHDTTSRQNSIYKETN